MLDVILDEISQRKLSLVFARIDASYPPEGQRECFNYLYGRILTTPGVLPNGGPTVSWFLTTIGRQEYAEWMEDEIRFYAKRYGKLPNLLGINLRPFSEPFSAERCGFLQLMHETGRYEITQYTPYAAKLWHGWLRERFGLFGQGQEVHRGLTETSLRMSTRYDCAQAEPSGYSRFLTDGIVRASHRNPTGRVKAIQAGKVQEYDIDLWATSNVFKAGHRIRLSIFSSNFPRFNRNLNTGEVLRGLTRMVTARQKVYHDTKHLSAIVLPLVPR